MSSDAAENGSIIRPDQLALMQKVFGRPAAAQAPLVVWVGATDTGAGRSFFITKLI